MAEPQVSEMNEITSHSITSNAEPVSSHGKSKRDFVTAKELQKKAPILRHKEIMKTRNKEGRIQYNG